MTPKSNTIRKCLLVDDDEDDREIFCLALNQVDPAIDCLTAADGLEALSILKEKAFVPDYIFLDLNMPRMDGKECLREIRKQKDLAHIPVIMFSTSSADKEKEETKRLGASSFIVKPSLVSILAENLHQIFKNGET